MQSKGIVRIAGILQLTDFRKCLLCAAVRAGQHDLIARNLFHNCLDRILSVQLHRRIQHRSAVLHAIWRRIAPAAAPVDAHGQAYHHFLLLHFSRRIVGKAQPPPRQESRFGSYPGTGQDTYPASSDRIAHNKSGFSGKIQTAPVRPAFPPDRKAAGLHAH